MLPRSVTPVLANAGMPGGVLSFINADGSTASAIWGSGSPGTDFSLDSLFAYRSSTKSFVGTVILQLADEGALSLTDPIEEYVPGVPGGTVITIDDLGRMRSGLANYSSLPSMHEALGLRLEDPPSTDTMLSWAFASSPDFSPGTQYEYSNTNTPLLGEVIESVTGMPWYDAVRTRLLDPLKLSSVGVGFPGGADDAPGFNVSPDSDPEPVPVAAPGWFGAAGALTGTVSDLARWGQALGNGNLLADTTQFARVESLGPTSDDPASPEYDHYGFALGEIEGWIGHTGNGLGFQSLVMHDPETNCTVAILVNGTGADSDVPAHLFQALLSVIDGEQGPE